MTHPDVLKLAREIAANIAPYGISKEPYLRGDNDGCASVLSAIAAIERTTEFASSWLKSTEPATQDWGSDVLIEQLHLRAMYLTNYDHLRQQGQADD